MIYNASTKAYDDDYEIIFSDSFNIYSNRLKITDIAGFTFEFDFQKGEFSTDGLINVDANNETKVISVVFKNFRSPLGAVNTNKLAVVKLSDGKQIFLSAYGKSLDPKTDFMHVSINFYVK